MPPHAWACGHPYGGPSLVPLGWGDLRKLLGRARRPSWKARWERGKRQEKRNLQKRKQQDWKSRSQGMPIKVLRASAAARAAAELPHRLASAGRQGLSTGQVGGVSGKGKDTVPTLPSEWWTATANKVSIIVWGALWGRWQHKPKLQWLWNSQIRQSGASLMTPRGHQWQWLGISGPGTSGTEPDSNFYLTDSDIRNTSNWPYILHNSDSVESFHRVFTIFASMQMVTGSQWQCWSSAIVLIPAEDLVISQQVCLISDFRNQK